MAMMMHYEYYWYCSFHLETQKNLKLACVRAILFGSKYKIFILQKISVNVSPKKKLVDPFFFAGSLAQNAVQKKNLSPIKNCLLCIVCNHRSISFVELYN